MATNHHFCGTGEVPIFALVDLGWPTHELRREDQLAIWSGCIDATFAIPTGALNSNSVLQHYPQYGTSTVVPPTSIRPGTWTL